MQSFHQFLETKDTSRLDAVTDIAKALQKVFKDYTRETRHYAWEKIQSKKGERLVKELLRTPRQSLSPFRTLVP